MTFVALGAVSIVHYFWGLYRTLSHGLPVKAAVVCADPYGPLAGHLSFAQYLSLRYTYLDLSGSMVVERGEFRDSAPFVGDAIWLVVDPVHNSRAILWR